jgi:hypothetical protein
MTRPAESPPPAASNRPWAPHILVPTLWTPELALAVVELLDDLRDAVSTLYAGQIQDRLRDGQRHGDVADLTAGGRNTTYNRSF